MATYLVTGVASFIASKVAEFLLADGHTEQDVGRRVGHLVKGLRREDYRVRGVALKGR